MYIINDIAYAGEPPPMLKIKSVRPLGDYRLWVCFSTDETKIFDFKPLLDDPVFIPLKDKAVFEQVYVDYSVAVWNDGDIDIAPEKLYADGIAVNDAEIA